MVHPRLAMLLPFLFLVATARLGVALEEDTASPLLDCAPAPPTPSADDDTAFRDSLASALRALPSAAAASPKGFAATRFGGTGRDRAFARGLCFGANTTSSPAAARACRACLSAAARDVTRGCDGRRGGGAWRAGCFVAYADDAAPSAREDAFRGWFYIAPSTTTVAPDRACAADRSAADCARCFEDSARAATATVGWLQRLRGDDVAVVGYSCCLRLRVSGWQWPSSRDPLGIFETIYFYLLCSPG